MANTSAMKRGFHYDKANSKLSIYVDGVEAANFTTTTASILPAGTAETVQSSSAFYPYTSDGNALGTSTYMWSDLFLASGGTIAWNATDVVLTHSANTLTLTGGEWNTGANGAGVDTKLFGGTASCYLLYDASEDKLSVVQTNAATSGVETSFSNAMTLTGIGASAEAALASITINAAVGTYTNAFCARTTYGASGKTTGYSGVICAEMNTSAGCTDGTYVIYEAEAIMAASSGVGTAYAVIGVNASGANVAAFDTSAYLFDIQGVTSNSGKFWYANKSVPFDAYLRIRVGATPYYIGVLAQQAAAS